MTRRIALATILLITSIASASTRTVDSGKTPNAAAVSGIVSSVSGHLVQLADGKITIDTTNAKFLGQTTIEPGMLVVATLSSTDVAANAPLPADTVTASRLPQATLFGPVQSVDRIANTITLLGRTIKVTAETSFGGILKRRDGDTAGLGDILPNQLVQVTADNVNGQLVAKSILLVAPVIPEVHTTRGTVTSIGATSWVIDSERGDDITLVIDAQTKIAGSPKVGDQVEVLYRVDSNNTFVAISIIKFEKPPTPPVIDIFRFNGKVKTIDASAWVITRDESGDQKVLINGNSKIEPGIVVGDSVEVLAQRKDDGSVTALAIVRRR